MTELTVTGTGTVGALRPGWSVTEQATAVAIGESSGSVGAAKVSAAKTATSEFVGGNDLELVHSELGTWNGKVTGVTLDGLSASLDVAGASRALVATTTAKPFMVGTHIYDWTMQGYLTQLLDLAPDGTLVAFNGSPSQITRWTVDGTFLNQVAANGTGNGQATGSNGGRGVVTDPTGTYIYFWRNNATNPIQKVTVGGSYVTGFSSIGSADGQVSGSGASNGMLAVLSNGNLVVGDSGNNRIQILSPTGAFITKWGTLGVATGQFTTLSAVTVDGNDNVWTREASGRIQQFTSAGAFVSTFAATSGGAGLAVNSAGTELYITPASPPRIERWVAGSLTSSWPEPLGGRGITERDGNLFYMSIDLIGRETSVTRTRAASNLEDALTYMAVLYDPAVFSIDYQAATNPVVALPGWSGDIWSRVKDLCAAYGVEWSVVDGVFTVRDVGSTSLTLSNNTPVALSAASQGGSRSLAIKYQNTQSGDNLTMYTAAAINTVNILETRSATFQTSSHPLSLNVPTPTDATTATPGTYHVQDKDGLDVPAAQWTYYGGSITPALGDVPGQIRITFQGPKGIIPGYTAPFSIASGTSNTRTPQLIITGRGVTVEPETIVVGTGADPEQAATTVGATIDNFAIATPAQAYSRGSWAQTLATGTDTQISFEMDNNRLAGFGLDVGSIIPYNSSLYRITDIVYGNVKASVTAHRHVEFSDVKTVFPATLVATNYSNNPSFEVNTTGYAERSNPGNTYVPTWSNAQAHHGTRSLLITASAGSAGGGVVFDINPPVQRNAGETIELSFWVRPNLTKLIRPRIYTYLSSNGTGTPTTVDGVDVSCTLNTWTKLTLSTTLAAGVRSYIPAVRTDGFEPTGSTFTNLYIDEVMNGNVGQAFFTGASTGAAEIYNWVGTANNSPSRRWTSAWTNAAHKALWAGYTNADIKVKPLRAA